MTIEERLAKIEERNARVEAEKAWETSVTRVASIAILTYVFACGALVAIGNTAPFLNAGIPVLGYLLSTISIPAMKHWWMNKRSISREG
jgi:hypothetical protein